MLGRILGSYRILREIGRGGMGAVYLAEHTLLGRHAAVKVLLPEYSANRSIVSRFFNEARAAAAIRNLGIVEVYDFGFAEDNVAYIAMEHLQGESLSQRLSRGRLSPPVALTVARQIAGPLAAAHRAGIVHRDLKPDNIFIVPDDEAAGGERVKLLDFGVAKLLGELGGREQTHSGAIVGTPSYMAPEQCRGVAIDHRADLYALGCILFKLLTGRAPFSGEGPGDVMIAHVYEPAPTPSSIQGGIDATIDAVVARLLAKRPDERFQRAEEVISALDACAAGLTRARSSGGVAALGGGTAVPVPIGTITSAPHTLPATLAQPMRSRRGLLFGAAAVVGAAGVAGALWGVGPGGKGPTGGQAARPAEARSPAITSGDPGAASAVAAHAPVTAPVSITERAQDEPPVDAAAAPTEDAHESEAADAEVGAETVAFRIESTPPGALVYFDGRAQGPTPLDLTLPRADKAVSVSVKLRGYRTERFTFVPSKADARSIKLRREPSGPAGPPNPFAD